MKRALITNMQNPRKYGNSPFNVVVIHGGPGAPGEMAPVARELSLIRGILEPLQTAHSIEGQLKELRIILEKDGNLPVTLIGFSWGALLSFIFASQYPALVKKLILLSSGVFEEKYAYQIMETRLSRLTKEDQAKINTLIETLESTSTLDKNLAFSQLGKLILKADSFNPLPFNNEILEYQYQIYQSVWKEAEELRKSGRLLRLGNEITCPVVAIHGDKDPHSPEGVRIPLSQIVKNFQFILLEKCGHYPWIEQDAKDRFYEILRKELN